ncbi:MAG: bifunctional phosphopantothenoylcysteine decarboxylase/phosphopantothenate--cysteine ligase CoaBC [Mogibacterium sp.]|nr:bifunctional phosphopantothenoylcysteine decarboxylase/phosphopantothenate--cysteine ligase CoaBC [Mogibacterium sp.]
MLTGKTIVLGVTGGIAAYKSAYLASGLKKQGANVHVVMTKHATEFISPLTFETLTNNRCVTDMFDRNFEHDVKHISLAKAADLIIVAPATANFIAKAANGIADDMLTTVVLAAKCRKLCVPAMNTAMYENPATQDNLRKLEHYGWKLVEPATGLLACGDEGKGKMPEPQDLVKHVIMELAHEKDLAGRKVLVTAGPTQEAIDPVRYITNHSSGKMGYALAEAAAMRGAEVTLVSGHTALEVPFGVTRVDVTSAEQMHDAVVSRAADVDFIFKAAAVADYKPATVYDHKVKKSDSDMSIPLTRTKDILADVAKIRRDDQVICGFAMETENLIENARGKLARKSLDMICANSLRTEGAGFAGDTNVVTVITEDSITELGKLSKLETAQKIIDIALKIRADRTGKDA